MNCIKCGVKLDSMQEVPLCKECGKADSTIKSSDASEILGLHIKSQKELGLLPKDFKLSDVGRDVITKIIYELLDLGEPREAVANTVFGFCYGYLCHQREQEPQHA
jgi:hypothetical protein